MPLSTTFLLNSKTFPTLWYFVWKHAYVKKYRVFSWQRLYNQWRTSYYNLLYNLYLICDLFVLINPIVYVDYIFGTSYICLQLPPMFTSPRYAAIGNIKEMNIKMVLYYMNRVMVFNAIFTNISAIPWGSVLLVEETAEYPKKTTTCRKSLTKFITYCYIEYTSPWAGFELSTLVFDRHWLRR